MMRWRSGVGRTWYAMLRMADPTFSTGCHRSNALRRTRRWTLFIRTYLRLARESDRRKQRADELEANSQRMRSELSQARSALMRIKNSMAWRYYQAVGPQWSREDASDQYCGSAGVDGPRWIR
jgi:hypothetical protein